MFLKEPGGYYVDLQFSALGTGDKGFSRSGALTGIDVFLAAAVSGVGAETEAAIPDVRDHTARCGNARRVVNLYSPTLRLHIADTPCTKAPFYPVQCTSFQSATTGSLEGLSRLQVGQGDQRYEKALVVDH